MNCLKLNQTPFEKATRAEVYYHPDVFTFKTKAALTATVAIGAIAALVGALALLPTTGLGAMGSTTALCLGGSGWTLMVVVMATTAILINVYFERKRLLHASLSDYTLDKITDLESKQYRSFAPDHRGSCPVFVKTDSGWAEVHLFYNEIKQDRYTNSLTEKDYGVL